MPNFDGTGPLGQGPMTGGRRGRCRGNASFLQKTTEAPVTTETQKTVETQNTEKNDVVFGVGRGGRPYGGGKGRLWGGGRNKNSR